MLSTRLVLQRRERLGVSIPSASRSVFATATVIPLQPLEVCVRTGGQSSNTKVIGGGVCTLVLPMLGFHLLRCLSKILSPAFPSGAVLSASP